MLGLFGGFSGSFRWHGKLEDLVPALIIVG